MRYNQFVQIGVEKAIPQGAGPGGGSSNAAATLSMLNEAAGFPFPHGKLLDMAARLGSDIPFFIEGKPAIVTGRGENLIPIEIEPKKDIFFVLVKPPFDSGTAEAYRLLDEARSRARNTRKPLPPEALIAALENPPGEWPYHNDFQDVFLDDGYPYSGVYKEIFFRLSDSGAQFVSLSGSGSAVFGVYENENAADDAAARLKNDQPFVRKCAAIRMF
jgi:4-diphosphocytidyl-2-C-methyl-D-erythritol kinase